MVVCDLQAFSGRPQGNLGRVMPLQNVVPNGQVCMAPNVLRSQLRLAVLPVVAKEAPGGHAAQFTSVARLVCDLQAYSSQPRGSCDRMMTMQNVDPNSQVCIAANVLPSQLKLYIHRHLLNLTGTLIYRELHRKLNKQLKARPLLISTRSRTLAQ